MNKKLSATYESLTYLQHCKKNWLVPNCVDNCINFHCEYKVRRHWKSSWSRSTTTGLLSLLIHSKYSDIRKIRSHIKILKDCKKLKTNQSSNWRKLPFKKKKKTNGHFKVQPLASCSQIPHRKTTERRVTQLRLPLPQQTVYYWKILIFSTFCQFGFFRRKQQGKTEPVIVKGVTGKK